MSPSPGSSSSVPDPAPLVAVSANSAWNIVHFRGGLIRGLRAAGYRVAVIAPPDAQWIAALADLADRHVEVPIERSGVNPATDLLLLARYRAILRRLRPAAYLGFTIKPNLYGCLAAGSLGIPAIPNVSGLGTAFLGRRWLEAIVTPLYRRAFARCPAVFFQNPDDLAVFTGRGLVRAEQARLLPGSGVDLARFPASPAPDDAPMRLLMIARVLRDKGVREFAEAARMLRGRGLRFQLLGGLDPANRSAIARSELDGWVTDDVLDYLGETSDVVPHIAAATAVVLPSYREGLPRTLLEGAAMARPLIASDVPGCREVVIEGCTGTLCRPRDARSLAEAVERVAALSAGQRSAMGAAARRLVEEKFGEQRVVQAYLGVLAQCTAG